MTTLPPLPPIASAQLRKRVFTHLSVFRLRLAASVRELEQIENADNDRLSFLGRAAIDYALSSTNTPDINLSACAHEYDIVKSLHRAWREPIDPNNPATLPPTASIQATLASSVRPTPFSDRPAPPTEEQATQLMEAYIGALVLESEKDGMQFAYDLVRRMAGLISGDNEETNSDRSDGLDGDERETIVPENVPLGVGITPSVGLEDTPSSSLGTGATGRLHDLAVQRGLVLSWDDHAQGPKHAQEWTSDVTLRDHKTNRTWPPVARGTGKSKKLARADAAAKVLAQWGSIV
ncbi:hypothetical protein FRC07_013932 [Ceratobasidium sp. 392]|nr:hypothetical protein FRC07_013932 [Ceratobasidium sp. 392]